MTSDIACTFGSLVFRSLIGAAPLKLLGVLEGAALGRRVFRSLIGAAPLKPLVRDAPGMRRTTGVSSVFRPEDNRCQFIFRPGTRGPSPAGTVGPGRIARTRAGRDAGPAAGPGGPGPEVVGSVPRWRILRTPRPGRPAGVVGPGGPVR